MKGIGASPGIVIGKAVIYWKDQIDILREYVENPDSEVERFRVALELSVEEIQETYSRFIKRVGPREAVLFQAHRTMARDPDFVGQIERMILDEGINAEWAVKQVSDDLIQLFDHMEGDHMKVRSDGVRNISDRVIKLLLHVGGTDISNLREDAIIVARRFAPADMAQIDRERTIGLVSEEGSRASHSAIIARTLEIPAVVSAAHILDEVENGDTLILDGESGMVLVRPDDETIEKYKGLKERYETFKKSLETVRGERTRTLDGVDIILGANIGSPVDLDDVLRNDGESIGLYRTESLYLDSDHFPTEETQFLAYRAVVEPMAGRPVTIRTLDVGGDKNLDYLAVPEEKNPFLGYRAIRICLDRPEVFKVQLRAMLRASAFGQVRILLPMISSLEELRSAKAILEEARAELREENLPFGDVQTGIMVEVPSTAILSDHFAPEVDFFSIGTNDLIQYTVAADRENEKLAPLYSQYHPAVLRLIRTVIDNGRASGVPVAMCGESAGDPKLIPVLLGLGLSEFSMNPSSILQARWILRNISRKDLASAADEALSLGTAREVEDYCAGLLVALKLVH